MIKNAILLLGVVGIASTLSAQDPGFQPAQSPRGAAPLAANTSASDVKTAGLINSMEQLDNTTPLQPGYEISFRVLEDRAEPRTLRVQDSGDIYAPNVGLVHAEGKTCRELAFTIKKTLEASIYQKATVIVSIDVIPKTFTGGGGPGRPVVGELFTIFGQVARQGKYEMPSDSDLSISQALLTAGGQAQFANMKKVKIIRKTPTGNKTIVVDVDAVMTKGALERDIFIRAGDVIIVPEKTVNF
jgi:protein involved in polysaccharide export with SLBB domain